VHQELHYFKKSKYYKASRERQFIGNSLIFTDKWEQFFKF